MHIHLQMTGQTEKAPLSAAEDLKALVPDKAFLPTRMSDKEDA